MEVVKTDTKKCSIFGDLARDTLEWRSKIHVAEPIIVGT